jgi:large conductance mechanosensitive channel
MLNEFKQFLMRGNVVDMAVGIVIGAAFGGVVTALVENLVTPLISAVAKLPDFSSLSVTLNGSELMYGNFINAFLSFVLVAAAIFFFVVKPMNAVAEKMKKEEAPADPTTKECVQCCGEIPMKAKRCKHCTQQVD